jgi:actin-related protein
MIEENHALVFDCGSDSIKAGMAGVEAPRSVLVNNFGDSWEEVEKMWSHTFDALKVDPCNCPGLLLTEE